ncbi:MarR family transcriptional regulator [Nocardia sp. NPDC003693]
MPLTESQATVLAALAALEPEQSLTVRQLCERTGFTSSGTRKMVNALAVSGLARCNRCAPAGWRITHLGLALISARRYGDYRSDRLGGDAAEFERPRCWLQYADGTWEPVWADGSVGDPDTVSNLVRAVHGDQRRCPVIELRVVR